MKSLIFQHTCICLFIMFTPEQLLGQTLPWKRAIPSVSGTVNCMLATRGTLVAGVRGNGIYFSTSAGVELWYKADAALRNVSFYSFAAINSTIIAGSAGSGAYRSTDNGRSWEESNVGLTDKFVQSMVVAGGNIFAGTPSGLYVSSDVGVTWRYVSEDLRNTNIVTLAANQAYLFVGTRDGIYRSSNSGVSWQRVGSNASGLKNTDIVTLFVKNNVVLAASTDELFKSLDNGTTWGTVSFPAGGYQNKFKAFTSKGNTIFGGTSGGHIVTTTDDGLTWKSLSYEVFRGVSSLEINQNNLFVGTFDAGIYFTSLPNAGITSIQESNVKLSLTQYPNPFTNETTLEYNVSAPEQVRLELLSSLGQTLALLKNEVQSAGQQTYTLNMSKYPAGIYAVRLRIGNTVQTKLLHLVR